MKTRMLLFAFVALASAFLLAALVACAAPTPEPQKWTWHWEASFTFPNEQPIHAWGVQTKEGQKPESFCPETYKWAGSKVYDLVKESCQYKEPVLVGTPTAPVPTALITTEKVSQGFGTVLTYASQEIDQGLNAYVTGGGSAIISRQGFTVIASCIGTCKLRFNSAPLTEEKIYPCDPAGCGFKIDLEEEHIIIAYFPQTEKWEVNNFPKAR